MSGQAESGKWVTVLIRDWKYTDAILPVAAAVVFVLVGLYFAGSMGGPAEPLLATWLWIFGALFIVYAVVSHYGFLRPVRNGAVGITLPVLMSIGLYAALAVTVSVIIPVDAIFLVVAFVGAAPALFLSSTNIEEGVAMDILLGLWLSAAGVMLLIKVFGLSSMIGPGSLVVIVAGMFVASVVVDAVRAYRGVQGGNVMVVGYHGGLDALLVILVVTSVVAMMGLGLMVGGY
jgi:uncharacterized membrane protein